MDIKRGNPWLIGSYWIRFIQMKGMNEDYNQVEARSDKEAIEIAKDIHRYERKYFVQAVQMFAVGNPAMNQPEIDMAFRDVGPALTKEPK